MANKKDINENINESDKVFRKVVLSWYPGHMVRAQNEIKRNLKLIDIVVEILDARLPISSRNPNLDELLKGKARIIVLNKSDLSDDTELLKWKKYFVSKNMSCITMDAIKSFNIEKLINEIEKKGKEIYKNKDKKGININRIYRALIVGIPNVGKSTIINKMAKKNIANTGNKPGVTKKNQWIRIDNNIDLLDTPGILWPNLNDNNVGIKLALTGNVKQEILDVEELAVEGINILLNNSKYKILLKEKYKLSEEDLELESYDILKLIGKKRGCVVSGGEIDTERIARIFVDEFKNGKIGKICLDIMEVEK